METIIWLAGSLLISVVFFGLRACGIWELLLQENSPRRRASLSCKASFPHNIGTVVTLPWCVNCMSFFFCHGGHSFVREGMQLIWGEMKGNEKLPGQSSGILCPQDDFSSHTFLAAFPFQIGITFSSHLSVVFLDAADCLIFYFCHSCRCYFICDSESAAHFWLACVV